MDHAAQRSVCCAPRAIYCRVTLHTTQQRQQSRIRCLSCHAVSLRVCHNMLAGSTGCAEWEAGLALSEALINHPHLVRGEKFQISGSMKKVRLRAILQAIDSSFFSDPLPALKSVSVAATCAIYNAGLNQLNWIWLHLLSLLHPFLCCDTQVSFCDAEFVNQR